MFGCYFEHRKYHHKACFLTENTAQTQNGHCDGKIGGTIKYASPINQSAHKSKSEDNVLGSKMVVAKWTQY